MTRQWPLAMAAGNGAFLADQDRPNIFTMSVGNLLPGQEATVCLGYATELEQHADSVRIVLPTTISPRYVPQPMIQSADPAELERINPPTVRGPVPYGLSLSVAYTAPQCVKSVACPSHPARVIFRVHPDIKSVRPVSRASRVSVREASVAVRHGDTPGGL